MLRRTRKLHIYSYHWILKKQPEQQCLFPSKRTKELLYGIMIHTVNASSSSRMDSLTIYGFADCNKGMVNRLAECIIDIKKNTEQ